MAIPASETGITGPTRAPAPPAAAPGGRGRRLWVELVTFFGITPALAALAPRWLVSFGIIGSGAFSLLVLLRDPTFSRSLLWRGGAAARMGLRGILRRTVLVWTALFAFTVLRRPDHLFDLPLGRPRLWLMVLLVFRECQTTARRMSTSCRTPTSPGSLQNGRTRPPRIANK